MSAIDLVVLGILKDKPMGAYDIQKVVESRHISKWVKISTPSIYKKVLQLEAKGLIASRSEKEGRMPEKAVYTITPEGERALERLMSEISRKPVRMFLDLNAVMVNLEGRPPEERSMYVKNIQQGIGELKAELEQSLREKRGAPQAGMSVLRQQYALACALDAWASAMRETMTAPAATVTIKEPRHVPAASVMR